MSTPHSTLESLGACREAIDFCRTYPDLESAWLACQRGDWMLWFASRRGGVDRKLLVRAACECARIALPHTQDPHVLACIEAAERWTRGEATIDEVRQARHAADAYSADSAAYSAYAAAYAAADSAAYSAAAAYSAYAAAYAYSAAADADAARSKTLQQCADIVRRHIPNLP